MSIKVATAEEATGIRGRGLIVFYHKAPGRNEEEVTLDEAVVLLDEGREIEVPGAGAGYYEEFAELCDLGAIQLWESTSSSGDWKIRLTEREGKFLAQRNRHPGYGFGYSIVEDLVEWHRG